MRLLCTLLLMFLVYVTNAQVKVYVHLDTSIHTTFSGRLLLLTQDDTTQRFGQVNTPQLSFAREVQNWASGQVQVFDDASQSSGASISHMKPGYYRLVAVMHANKEERAQIQNAGNAYSKAEQILHITENGTGEQHVYINAVFQPRKFRETPLVKEVSLKSSLLSSFHKKEMFIKAAVILPDSMDAGARYPVVFVIPGWGGTHFDALNAQARSRYGIGKGKKKIYVYLNPESQTRWGLHALVDSDVNGPWGKALVNELVPYLSQNYPVSPEGKHHFVMGQSSGGYGALWLQLNYPDAFNGCWAVSPDPVDFSDFTGVKLYAPGVNMYTDENGKERGLFLQDGKPTTTIRNMVNADEFTGDGGQFQSFEAEFGKAGSDGRPLQLFSRKTGQINQQVLTDWKRYDMGLYLQRTWPLLGRGLAGKVHVYAGGEDNFYLNRSVNAFAAKAAEVKADIIAETIPGADHWSIWSPAFTERVQRELDARIHP